MALLSLEHVGKTHRVGPYEKRVLADVSLAIDPGDLYSVWGAKRSGKSTLLRVAAGLEAPDAGTVRFDGRDLAGVPGAERDRLRLHEIGLVQGRGPRSDALRVLEYVALPLLARCPPREARARALAALERVGVAECRDAAWSELSFSEQSLVSLAHGIVREPSLLLVDDPMAGVEDSFRQREIVELLRGLAAERRIGVLMTTSVLAALMGSHEAFTLGDGRLVPVTAGVGRASAEVIELPRDRAG